MWVSSGPAVSAPPGSLCKFMIFLPPRLTEPETKRMWSSSPFQQLSRGFWLPFTAETAIVGEEGVAERKLVLIGGHSHILSQEFPLHFLDTDSKPRNTYSFV